MKANYYIQRYRCTLEEPVVLKNYAGSEIKVDVHDFINGNKFLGITAKALYKEASSQERLDLFHNGKVQYDNAYLSIDDTKSYPMPSTLYAQDPETLKGDYYVSGVSKKKESLSEDPAPKKYKQIRTGYLIPDTAQEYLRLKARKGERLKSAYNIDNRSASSGNMFLYQYLEKGQEFIFEVRDYKNGQYLERIEDVLIGTHYIATGKGEFGKITIEAVGAPTIPEIPEISFEEERTYWVYAYSDLAFIDSYGKYTWLPTATDFGCTNARIDYPQSRLWFDRYTVRNGKRRTIDPERLIIKKGSVFALTAIDTTEKIAIDTKARMQGVGVHLSEGLGRILVNPDFLTTEASFSAYKEVIESLKEEQPIGVLGTLLAQRYKNELEEIGIYEAVLQFIDNKKRAFEKISPSQWGAIRHQIYELWYTVDPNRRKDSLLNSLFDTTHGFIAKSKKNNQWSAFAKAELEKLLKNMGPEALLLCTIEMPKHQKSTS